MKVGRRAKWLIFGLLVVGLSVAFYRAPDENFRRPSLEQIIRHGQLVAYTLYLRGGAPPVYGYVLEPAKGKSEATVRRELSLEEIMRRLGVKSGREGLGLPTALSSAALIPDVHDFRLIVFERKEDLFVMTFVYQRGDESVLAVPGKGPLLFGVVLRFVMPPDDSATGRLFRKIANMPLIGIISPWSGTVGRIALTYFRLNGYRTDVVEWIERDRAQLSQQLYEGARRALESLKDPDYLHRIRQEAESRLDEHYDWAQATMDGQFRHVSASLKH